MIPGQGSAPYFCPRSLSNCFSVENIAEDIQQQKEDLAELDIKVGSTIDTVITIGDKVIEHEKDIGQLQKNLSDVDERVEQVEENVEETKIKIEEIDNKVEEINNKKQQYSKCTRIALAST